VRPWVRVYVGTWTIIENIHVTISMHKHNKRFCFNEWQTNKIFFRSYSTEIQCNSYLTILYSTKNNVGLINSAQNSKCPSRYFPQVLYHSHALHAHFNLDFFVGWPPPPPPSCDASKATVSNDPKTELSRFFNSFTALLPKTKQVKGIFFIRHKSSVSDRECHFY